MGVYLNSSNAFTLYKNEISKPYFVDKPLILKELVPMVREDGHGEHDRFFLFKRGGQPRNF